MKIVIIGTAFPMRGGIAQYNSILYKYLSKDNDVRIFSFKRQYPEFLFPGKTQFETGEPAFKIPEDKNVISIDSVNPINWILTAFKIRKENPDLLIYKYWIPFFAPCFFTISFFAKMFRKTKVLFICDNVIPHEKRFGDRFFTKLVFSVVDYFIVQSKTVEKDLAKFDKKNKPYKLSPHPLYNIFGEKLDKPEARKFIEENYNVKFNSGKIILFFGYIRKYKGLMYLIEAMNELGKDVKLLVAGEFYDDEKPYREKIKESGLEENILLLSDFMPDERVRYFFSACDCLVLPYTDATQSGIVQIAYYYDKPVIVTDVGGLSEVVISEKTGLIIKPGNVEEIAKAVNRFYSENLEEKFSENIKTEKLKYSWEVFVRNIMDLTEIKSKM